MGLRSTARVKPDYDLAELLSIMILLWSVKLNQRRDLPRCVQLLMRLVSLSTFLAKHDRVLVSGSQISILCGGLYFLAALTAEVFNVDDQVFFAFYLIIYLR